MLDLKRARYFRYLIVSVVTVFLLVACAGNDQTEKPQEYPTSDWEQIPAQLPESMKGYELYSWQSGEDWVFTLTTGTNRTKSFEEITAPENSVTADGLIKITVTDLEDLKKLLTRLPAGTELFWSGIDLTGEVEEGIVYFSYPAEQTLQMIAAWAEELHIRLHTLHNP